MLTDNKVKSFIQTQLTQIATTLEYNDIVFNGDVGFYDHQWIKRNLGEKITPFVITPISTEVSKDGLNIQTTRYMLLIMGFSKNRERMQDIINSFIEYLSSGINRSYEDEKLSLGYISGQSGVDFVEGSGNAEKRYEIAIEFEVVSTNDIYDSNDISLTIEINDVETILPFKSFRYEHGKNNFLNINNSESGYSTTNNWRFNTNSLVIECYLTSSILDLIKTQNSNITYIMGCFIDNITLFQNFMKFSGYQFSNERGQIGTVFLYFEPSKANSSITIDDITIPIVDYGIALETLKKEIITPNSNIIKHKFLGKVRVYSFEVAEEDSTLLTSLFNDLLSDNIEKNYYTVYMNLIGKTFTKNCLLSNIETKKSNDNVGTLVLKFLDGVDNNG